MFVSKKTQKQCCDARKINCTQVKWVSTRTMNTIKLCVVTALLGIFMETTNIKMSLDLGSLYVNINDVVIIFYIMIQNITKSLIVICTFLAVRLRSNCGHAVRCGQLPYDRMRCGAVAVTFLGLRCGAVAVTFWYLRCGAVAVKHQALRCGRGHMFRWPRRALVQVRPLFVIRLKIRKYTKTFFSGY